jgi:hypothetical protein
MCANTSPEDVFGAAATRSSWLDLARGRLRLDRLSHNGAGSTFFPWAMPIPREARKQAPPRRGLASAILRYAPARARVRRRSPPAS